LPIQYLAGERAAGPKFGVYGSLVWRVLDVLAVICLSIRGDRPYFSVAQVGRVVIILVILAPRRSLDAK